MFPLSNLLLLLDTSTLIQLNATLGYFFFAFTGSYIQEILAVYRGTQKRTKMHKIIIGTIIGALLYFILKNRYLTDMDIISSAAINLFCGSLGYEIFSKCSSIENLKKLARDLHDIVANIFGIDEIFKGISKKKDTKKEEDEEG